MPLTAHMISTGLLTLAVAAPASVNSPLDVIDQCVVVETATGDLGTAFWVGGGRLVTAAHVVGDERVVWLRSGEPDPLRQRAAVLLVDTSHDVAVLQPEQVPANAGLQILEATFPAGSRAYAIGSPIGDLVLSQGLVVGKVKGLIETSTPVDPGSSGGPLVDEHGRVRGLVVSMSRINGHAFAVPADVVQGILAKALALPPSSLPPAPTGGSSQAEGAISQLSIWIPALCVLMALAFALIWIAVHSRPRRIVITMADLQQGPRHGP